MDLLGPIFAYLGSVTAIVLAFVASYDAIIYGPLHAAEPSPQSAIAFQAKAASPTVRVAQTSGNNKHSDAAVKAPFRESMRDQTVHRRRELAREARLQWPKRKPNAAEWANRASFAHAARSDSPAIMSGMRSNGDRRVSSAALTRIFRVNPGTYE